VTLPIIPAIPLPSTPVPAASAPTRIVIPSIRLDAPVVEVGWRAVQRGEEMVTEWEVAENAVGFHIGSAYPGNPGNTVLSGHHNIKGKVFRYLVNVEPGAEIILYAEDRAYHYKVESKQILPEKYASDAQRAKNAELIGPFPDERLTLVTCWPYTGSTHRVVVVARPAPPTAGAR
jgi:sortase A